MSNKRSRHTPTMKTPLTFSQRYGFLIFGTLVSALLIGALVLGWMAFQEKRSMRAMERSHGDAVFAGQARGSSPAGKADRMALTQAFARGLPRGEGESTGTAPQWQPITPPDAEQRHREAQTVLEQFWNAVTWQEKARHVRDAPRVQPMMRQFYEVEGRHDPRSRAFRSHVTYRTGTQEVEHLIHENAKDGMPLEIALLRDATGALKLDWESFTGAGEMTWMDFLKQRPSQPVLLRAYARTDDYYNYEFNEPSRHLCVKLLDSTQEHTLYAYAANDGPDSTRLRVALERNKLAPVTVRVAYSARTESTNCVHLMELVADRWLLLDDLR